MKKILVIGLISGFFSAGVFAAPCPDTSTGTTIEAGATTGGTADTEECICDGGAAIKNTVNGGSGNVLTAPVFVTTGFDVQCSANTLVSYNEVSGTEFVVASGSKKGNQSYAGSSNGGAVAIIAKCTGTNDACTGANVTSALTAAKSGGSS